MSKRHFFGAVILQVSLLCAVLFAAPAVHADPPQINAIQDYCKQHIPKKAEGGCTTGNINKIISNVSDNCDGKNQQACIQNAAQDFIDKIANKHPNSTSDFNDALAAVIAASKPGLGGGTVVDKGAGTQGEHCSDGSDNCDLVKLYVNPLIRVLTITVGLVIVASLIMGGIQYTTSSGDPQKTGAAKSRIQNTLLAFFAYAFMFAFLNFLVPGGIF
jgi:hypothetical protein